MSYQWMKQLGTITWINNTVIALKDKKILNLQLQKEEGFH
jgi:hypothetical protein